MVPSIHDQVICDEQQRHQLTNQSFIVNTAAIFQPASVLQQNYLATSASGVSNSSNVSSFGEIQQLHQSTLSIPSSGTATLTPLVLPPISRQQRNNHVTPFHLTSTQPANVVGQVFVHNRNVLSNIRFADQLYQNNHLRSGKWMREEEEYANLLIDLFEKGQLSDCGNGATLRSYLSQKLCCPAMRISKKYAGKGIGKMVYLSQLVDGLNNTVTLEERVANETKLKDAEQKFHKAIPNTACQNSNVFPVSIHGQLQPFIPVNPIGTSAVTLLPQGHNMQANLNHPMHGIPFGIQQNATVSNSNNGYSLMFGASSVPAALPLHPTTEGLGGTNQVLSVPAEIASPFPAAAPSTTDEQTKQQYQVYVPMVQGLRRTDTTTPTTFSSAMDNSCLSNEGLLAQNHLVIPQFSQTNPINFKEKSQTYTSGKSNEAGSEVLDSSYRLGKVADSIPLGYEAMDSKSVQQRFASKNAGHCLDGSHPYSMHMVDSDGNLLGMSPPSTAQSESNPGDIDPNLNEQAAAASINSSISAVPEHSVLFTSEMYKIFKQEVSVDIFKHDATKNILARFTPCDSFDIDGTLKLVSLHTYGINRKSKDEKVSAADDNQSHDALSDPCAVRVAEQLPAHDQCYNNGKPVASHTSQPSSLLVDTDICSDCESDSDSSRSDACSSFESVSSDSEDEYFSDCVSVYEPKQKKRKPVSNWAESG